MLASDLNEARNSLGCEKHLRAKAFIAITVTVRVEFDVAEACLHLFGVGVPFAVLLEDEPVCMGCADSIAVSWGEYTHLHPRRGSPDVRLRTIERMEKAVRSLADSERQQASFRRRVARGEVHLLEWVA